MLYIMINPFIYWGNSNGAFIRYKRSSIIHKSFILHHTEVDLRL